MADLTMQEIDELCERSKDDRAIIVGSEIRMLCAAARRGVEEDAKLPDGMKHCTILFKECEKGHGWLTATNWVQHLCPVCRAEKAEAELAAIKAAQPQGKWVGDKEYWEQPSAISDERIDIVVHRQGTSTKLGELVRSPDGCWELRVSQAAAQEGK